MRLQKIVLKNDTRSAKQMCRFYCCLLNTTANAIIKATFMIVILTNPKNSSLIIVNKTVSIISTTPINQSHNLGRGYVKRWQHTHLLIPIFYAIYYTIFFYKIQANKSNFFDSSSCSASNNENRTVILYRTRNFNFIKQISTNRKKEIISLFFYRC